jgi:sialic acid synthase SpsE
MIEKHFTLDKTLPGPDHSSASEPEEFASLVRSIRDAEAALGSGEKLPSTSEQANAANMRRSLVARSRINAGTVIQEDQLTCRRPSTGISPMLIDLVAGRMAGTDIAEGTAISWEMLG